MDENKAMAVMHLASLPWISTRFQCVKCICRPMRPAGGLLANDGSVKKPKVLSHFADQLAVGQILSTCFAFTLCKSVARAHVFSLDNFWT